ncbi:MAG: GNAT family N-acetyltransferase [Clostridia bacterium]|nr:GNAT family N-acetyltransferase [Clostridia bacterium]
MSFCIETKRLRLRNFTLDDVKDFFDITRDEDVKKYLPYAYFETMEEVKKAFDDYYLNGDNECNFYLIVEEKSSNLMVGIFVVTQNILGEYAVNWMIGKKYRRKGYSHEALHGFCNYLPKGSKLTFTIEASNTNSIESIKKVPGIIDDSNNYVQLAISVANEFPMIEMFILPEKDMKYYCLFT